MEIIHIVLGKANPDRMNGVNKVVYQLATRQAASGRKVSIWGITPSPEHNYGTRNFETQLYRAYKNPFKLDGNLKKDLAKKAGSVVVHLHGGWIPVYATLSKELANLNIPFVLTAHGAYNTIAMKRSFWAKKLYFSLFEKNLLNRAARVHCIGESEVLGLQEIYPSKKSFLLPYGFELSTSATEQFTNNATFVIGFVGRLDIYTKGLDLLLKSLVNFNSSELEPVIWIVGDSEERDRLKQAVAQQGLEQKVVIWGSKFGREKDELMQKMDVFVHPSRNEGMPASVIEAAAMGIPCVVTQATNVGSYLKQYDAGCVVENESVNGLRTSLEHLCRIKKENGLGSIGQNGKRMVAEIFNWKTIVQQFDQLYAQV